jgi:hypothetical protein
MIPKSGHRFSEKIMLHQEAKAGGRFEESHHALAKRPAFRVRLRRPTTTIRSCSYAHVPENSEKATPVSEKDMRQREN